MADNQLRVGEAIIDLLAREYGVDVVYGIPGVHNIELYRGLHRSGGRAISPRHEQGAGFMADGWSIITGRPGVCVLISGPGVTNVLTPIAQAYHDSRPMLVLASTTPTDALGKSFGPLHDLPTKPKSLSRFVHSVKQSPTRRSCPRLSSVPSTFFRRHDRDLFTLQFQWMFLLNRVSHSHASNSP